MRENHTCCTENLLNAQPPRFEDRHQSKVSKEKFRKCNIDQRFLAAFCCSSLTDCRAGPKYPHRFIAFRSTARSATGAASVSESDIRSLDLSHRVEGRQRFNQSGWFQVDPIELSSAAPPPQERPIERLRSSALTDGPEWRDRIKPSQC